MVVDVVVVVVVVAVEEETVTAEAEIEEFLAEHNFRLLKLSVSVLATFSLKANLICRKEKT